MQQQIQIDNEAEALEDSKQQPPSAKQKIENNSSFGPFLELNDEEVIEEHINENYEQDFDSISSHSPEEPIQQIKEECSESSQNEEINGLSAELEVDYSTAGQEVLKTHCEKLEKKALRLKSKLERYTKQYESSSDDLANNSEINQQIYQLKSQINENNLILQETKKSQQEFLGTKLGKEAFSLTFLLTEDDELQQKMAEETVKVNTLIHFANLQIMRFKRQIKKNSQVLPYSEEEKEQLYSKYKKMKREMDEKKEKADMNEAKITQLQAKSEDLRLKFQEIEKRDIGKQLKDEKIQKQIEKRYRELLKRKQIEAKKNNLSAHQIQNTCHMVARTILEMRRENQELTQKIELIDQKSNLIEKDGQRLMDKFNNRKRKAQQRQTQKESENFQESSRSRNHIRYTPTQIKKLPEPIDRSKNHSDAKRTRGISEQSAVFRVNTEIEENERYTSKVKEPSIQLEMQPNNKLGQSSTANTLKKQFKLKLPNKTPKPSEKNLNISLEISHEIHAGRNSKKGAAFSKLSITQRLERIQLLEREDRIYSHKLYESSRRQPAKAPSMEKDSTVLMTQINLPEIEPQNNMKPLNIVIPNVPATPATPLPPTQQKILENNSEFSEVDQFSTRTHHTYFKKRMIYREKKISEQYMKMLESRGRKILELDDESEA